MKFRALPCPGSQFLNPSDSADRLSENLAASLSSAPACFLFQLQLLTKPNLQSVEDPTGDTEQEVSDDSGGEDAHWSTSPR